MDPTDGIKSIIPIETEFSLVQPLGSRDASLNKDAALWNVFVDPQEDGRKLVVKRPGMLNGGAFDGGSIGNVTGIFNFKEFILAAADGNLTRYSSPTSAGYTLGTVWQNTFNAPWQARRAFACVVFQNKIWVIGGTFNAAAGLRDVWSTEDGENWTQVSSAAPWGDRFLMEAVVFNNRLYVMGGTDSAGGFYNDVWVTDDGVNWTQVTASAGWSARSGFQVTAFKNGMMLTGGNVGGAEVWFTTDGGNWSLVQLIGTTFTARSQHRCVVWNDTLVLMGGSSGSNEVWSTIDGASWTLLTAAAFAVGMTAFGAVVYNDAIYVMAGFSAGYLNDVQMSTDGGANWSLVTAAYGGPGVFQGGMVVFKAPPRAGSVINAPVMYFMGGSDGTPTFYNTIWWASINGTLSTTYVTPFASGGPPQQAVTHNSNQYFVIKDTSTLAIWYADTVKEIQDTNYPEVTVPGIVNLDETLYVMTPDALISGSAIGNPFVWPSLNFIGADYTPDGGVALCRYTNFVMAMGPTTSQFFYNSGAPYGTLLRPVKNANVNVGCLGPYTVIEMENTVVWVGRTEALGGHVFRMNGMQPEIISTPIVDAIIDETDMSAVRASYISCRGHPWYVLNFYTRGYSLVYDFTTKLWYVWTRDLFGNYGIVGTATNGTDTYMIDPDFKNIWILDPNGRSDAGEAIDCTIYTRKIRNNTSRMKQCARATIIGDRTPNAVTLLSYSDDDYATWSTPRFINCNQRRQTTTRLGRYTERAWKLNCVNASTDWRVELLSTELKLGDA